MTAQLRINGRTFVGEPGRDIVVGRDPSCDVVLEHPRVSRRHLVARLEGDAWVARDAGSANGTWSGTERIDAVSIHSATTLFLGDANGARVELEPFEAQALPEDLKLGKLSIVHQTTTDRARIGRDTDNDIVLDDLRASRHHAEFVRDGGAFEIVDLDSHNGTFVNGRKVQRARLDPLDLVTIGNTLLRFRGGKLEQYVDQGEAWFEALGLGVTIAEGRPILDDVSLSLEPSSLLAIVGPSGAGKSTLLNALTGGRPAQRGAVLYGGRDLYEHYDDLRMRMGYVPQDDILHPQLSVRRALEFAAELRFPPDVGPEQRSARVNEVMAELGIAHRADVRIESLSGGQRKRTSIALELLTKPALLFLDEPTSGLDPGNEAQVMELLRALADGGRIVVVVTHSVQSLGLCDRVLFLAPGGTTAYFGPPRDALRFFREPEGENGYARVFRALDEERTRDWRGAFVADETHQVYVAQPLARSQARRTAGVGAPTPPQPQQRWSKQFSVLVRRYIAVLRADRRALLLIALQAPLFAVLDLLMVTKDSFNTAGGVAASLMLWLIVVGATWLGASNAIREIVKELPIYRRERAVGLSISAYLASKVVVLGAITIVQSIVLVNLALVRQHMPPSDPVGIFPLFGKPLPLHGNIIGSSRWEIVAGVVLAGLAAMTLGLLISASVRATDRALVILPVVLIAQIVVSLPILPQRGALQAIGYASSAQWGMSATASTVSLDELRAPYYAALGIGSLSVFGPEGIRNAAPGKFHKQWAHSKGWWLGDIGATLVLFVIGLFGSWFVLKRRDASVLTSGPPRAAPGG